MSTLIVTNGDVAAETLRIARPADTVLPWADVLHDGPVRMLPAAKFRAERAAFLADGEVNSVARVSEDLAERDAMIAGHKEFERIELWFEHDLYDQLQIIQVVNMLAEHGRSEDVFHIPAPRHLGPIPADKILELEGLTLPVNAAMVKTAQYVWSAYCQDTPAAFDAARKTPIAGFPFLGQAILRSLQELPGVDGVTRTERQILYTVDRGVLRPGMLFARVLSMEEAAFLGDWSFFSILTGLAFGKVPLLTGLPEPFTPAMMQDNDRRKAFITANLALTTFGRDVLAGREDRVRHTVFDAWLGGTHITNDNLWRWDDRAEMLIAPL